MPDLELFSDPVSTGTITCIACMAGIVCSRGANLKEL